MRQPAPSHQMVPPAEHTIERAGVAFAGAQLPAYCVSAGEGARPTLIALGGFDSMMEVV